MLPLQPYHPQRYPPVGPRWVQFGDDILGDATNDARTILTQKHQWKQQLHIGRLQEQGMMPLHAKRPSHPDSEEEFYEPDDGSNPPRRPPRPPSRPPSGRKFLEPTGEVTTLSTPERHYIGEDGEGGTPAGLLTGASNGANSTAANMGAAVIHGIGYVAGVGTAAVLKGGFRALKHLASGRNPNDIIEGEESETEEPLRPYARPKERAKPSGWGGSSGSGDRPIAHPFPARPFVDVAPYNGTGAHAIDLTGPDALRPPSRPVAQRDTRLARETLAAMGNLPRRRNGR